MSDYYIQDHNRCIKSIFSQIRDEGLSDDLTHSLCVELMFALLNNIDYRGAPLYLLRDSKMYLILYTSFDEFEKHFDEGSHSHTSFEWYLKTLSAPVYFYMDSSGSITPTEVLRAPDGIIFDMYGDEFVLEGELLNQIRKFFKIDLCSVDELKEIFKNSDNRKLEELLKREPKDWDEIILEISNSNLWVLMSLSAEAEHVGYSALFNIFEDNPFAYNENITLYTKNSLENQFALTVDFKTAADYSLSFGLSGITLKTEDDEIFMSRQLLVDKYDLIRKTSKKRFERSYQCLFDLWRGYCGFKS